MMTALVAPLFVVVIIGGVVAVGFSQGWFTNDKEDQREEKEELSTSQKRDEYQVPIRRKHNAWPLPLKLLIMSVVALFAGLAYLVYDTTQTGAPLTASFGTEIYVVIATIVGLIGGVRLRAWSDNRVDWETVVYDTNDGVGRMERIPYLEETVVNGSRVVKVAQKDRILGLFWRFKLVAQRKDLRGAGKIPEDPIEHEIPDHGSRTDDGMMIQTSPDGDKIIEGPTNADVTYRSKDVLSTQEASRMKTEKRQIQIENDSLNALIATLQKQIQKLRTVVENNEHRDREDLKEDQISKLCRMS